MFELLADPQGEGAARATLPPRAGVIGIGGGRRSTAIADRSESPPERLIDLAGHNQHHAILAVLRLRKSIFTKVICH